jgi:osmotically inducible lipoprotein OsmB
MMANCRKDQQAGDGSLTVISALACQQLSDTWSTINGRDPMKRVLALMVIGALMATAGCANMTPRQQRALSGGAIGAAGGAALGAIVGGSPAVGAALGGAAGAATGALIK